MIKVENLSKAYVSSSSKTEALKDISFHLLKGDILGILGPNGAGKSTLVKILATVLNRDDGKIEMAGYSIDDTSKYRGNFTVAMQNSSLELWLTVEENLKIYGKFHGLERSQLSNKIDEVIELFELTEHRKKRAAELSGGYKKRLQLAKIFLVDTPIIMMDEPTVGLDPIAKNKVIELLKQKSLEGKTIIFTTQIISEAEALCNKLMILNHGIIVAEGNLIDIKNRLNSKKKLEFKFEIIAEDEFAIASSICAENCKSIPERCDNSILFDLSIDEKRDKAIIFQLFESLNPKSVSIKEPTLEEIFIEIVKGNKDEWN